MNSRRLLCGALTVSAAFTWSCGRPESTSSDTVAAPDACAVALAPASESSEADREISRLKTRARQGQDTQQTLEQLGYRYIARARVTNDAGDYTLAEKTAECLSRAHADAAAALLLRGHVLHQLHRFGEAEQIARQLVARRGLVFDYGLLGDSLMDQGRFAEAAAAYQKMIDLKPFYQSYTRASHLRWMKGDPNGAIELMRMAIQAASPRDRESVAWAYTRLANYQLQTGRLSDAAEASDSALAYQPDYAAALLARGRVLLARNRPAEALEPLRHAATLNPLPEYQWALGDALRLCERNEEAELVEADLMARGAESDPRTLALFLATRRTAPMQAIAVAERELQTRADVFTLDALAWALAAGGRLDEAGSAMTRALAAGTRDARLFLHAAAIADLQGRRNDARRWLTETEALQSTLLPSELVELRQLRHRVAGRANRPGNRSLTQE
jgi:tetratricopeptide (TPR) repeat protein